MKRSIALRKLGSNNVRLLLLAGILTGSLVGACSGDDDDDGGNGAGTGAGARAGAGAGNGGSPEAGDSSTENPSGGPSVSGRAGEAGVVEGGAGGAGTSGGATGGGGADASDEEPAAAGAGGGNDGTDRDAFRPEELPFDQAAFDALSLPAGFSINVFRSGLGQARMLAVHGEHVYVTQPMQGNVLRLVDDDEDGIAEAEQPVAAGLPMVHGIAFAGDQVFLANVHDVYRATVSEDGSFGTPTPIITDLPDGGQHPYRTLGIGPDNLLYISVGSSCDACPEDNPEHATLLQSTLLGQPAGQRTIYARGLRNTIGFEWHPETEALWGMDQGSDWRGDDLPPEELNQVEAAQNYGWPYCYGNRQIDPVIQDPPDRTKAAYCATTTAPVQLNQAHQSPIGFAFYTAAAFPAHYQNGAFIAFRGSWNRKPATGYRIAFIPFEAGQPGEPEDFVSGFLINDGAATFARPAGVAVAPDGALLFTDDSNGVVYRVQYE